MARNISNIAAVTYILSSQIISHAVSRQMYARIADIATNTWYLSTDSCRCGRWLHLTLSERQTCFHSTAAQQVNIAFAHTWVSGRNTWLHLKILKQLSKSHRSSSNFTKI